jgi:hypothetical protein
MKRHIPGLYQCSPNAGSTLEGLFLVRVERASYRWHSQKPFFTFRFAVIEPAEYSGQTITGRIYCSPKALWKLNWFLRDFGYDPDLLGREEVEERALLGLRGIVRISHTSFNDRSYLNLEAFAPASEWEEFSADPGGVVEVQRAGHDV